MLGLVTASEDGSYVYFVADGKLTGEQNSEGAEPVAGQPNLYLSHAGGVTFIATLTPNPRGNEEFFSNGNGDEGDWLGEESAGNNFDFGPGRHLVRVAPDGTVLAFGSVGELTKYDNRAAGPGECENERCSEVYVYDAVTGKLACVSCDPGGSRPVGRADFNSEGVLTGLSGFYLPRNISEGGGRVFFESPDPLVPYDSNGLLDVYEWERPGVGSCTQESPGFSVENGGCVFPVSNVAGGSESRFMDASASGSDVFIATGDQLVPGDTDSLEDVYDVRVDGGFPAAAGGAVVCVNAESCRAPVSRQPGVFGTLASATFSGPGDPAPPPVVAAPVVRSKAKPKSCRKGFVKNRQRKCVRRGKRARKATRAAATRRAGS